jgi:hypothetical protein
MKKMVEVRGVEPLSLKPLILVESQAFQFISRIETLLQFSPALAILVGPSPTPFI